LTLALPQVTATPARERFAVLQGLAPEERGPAVVNLPPPQIRETLDALTPEDAATVLHRLTPAETLCMLHYLSFGRQIETLTAMCPAARASALEAMSLEELHAVLPALNPAERVSAMKEMADEEREGAKAVLEEEGLQEQDEDAANFIEEFRHLRPEERASQLEGMTLEEEVVILHNIEAEYRAATIRAIEDAIEAELNQEHTADPDWNLEAQAAALRARHDQLLASLTVEDREDMEAAQAAETELEMMDDHARGQALEKMAIPQRLAVIHNMPVAVKATAIAAMDDEEAKETLVQLGTDECIRIMNAMTDEQSEAAMELVPPEIREQIVAEEARESTIAEMGVNRRPL